jgi:TonB family protein
MSSLTIAAVLAAAATAAASTPAAILAAPDLKALLDHYPVKARQAGQEGRAVIRCLVRATGLLTDCVVASEEPVGFEFGAAALQLAPLFKVRPATAGGHPVDGASAQVPISFRLAAAPRLITDPQWTGVPRMTEAVYPPRAIKARVTGITTVECEARGDGTMKKCVCLEETPAGFDFGRAAVRLGMAHRIKPRDLDGSSVAGAHVRFQIRFDMDFRNKVPAGPGLIVPQVVTSP